MSQAIEIVGKAEEEGLANLDRQATPRGARRKLALDRRKDGFHLAALPVWFFRESTVHLIPNGAIGDAPALCAVSRMSTEPVLILKKLEIVAG